MTATREDVNEYLQPTAYVDSDAANVVAFARRVAADAAEPIGRAVALYRAVRDEIVYTPYCDFRSVETYRASACLARGSGFCVAKSALLAASARAVGIPARLGFADVRNHLASPRLRRLMGTDVFYYHGYSELYLDGAWAKATPVFDRGLCERFGVPPLEFDGRQDSLFQAYDPSGRRHMEYLRDRGPSADVPAEAIIETFERHYPALIARATTAPAERFRDEAAPIPEPPGGLMPPLNRAVAVVAVAALAGCGGTRPASQAVEAGQSASHAARTSQPAFEASGPDATDYGAGPAGFPRADRSTWWSLEYLVDSHSRLDEIVPARAVARAAVPSPLRRAATEPAITYRFEGESRTLEGYLARHPATGLVIARGDTILVERYEYGRRDTHRFTSWSMAKTITAMLVGIALDEGRIRSIDDRPDAYVPELVGTEYGRTPIRHLLTMSSGVKFIENYSGRDDVSLLVANTFQGGGPGGPSAVVGFNERLRSPGSRFSYASSETYVLGLVLRAAVRQSLADYLSDRIWRPMGAEADATWLIDNAGQESAYCCVNAVLRDYARLGLLLAHDGRLGDRQIIPRAWVHAATIVPAESWHLKPYAATRYFGYGYQTWIFPGERRMFALLGVRGQAIYVDPAAKLVLVHTAVRKLPDDLGAGELDALWAGIREQLGKGEVGGGGSGVSEASSATRRSP